MGVAVYNSSSSPTRSSRGSSTAPVRISGPLTSIITATCRLARAEAFRTRPISAAAPLAAAVRHVEAQYIDARQYQLPESLVAFGSWPNRRDNLGVSIIAAHERPTL